MKAYLFGSSVMISPQYSESRKWSGAWAMLMGESVSSRQRSGSKPLYVIVSAAAPIKGGRSGAAVSIASRFTIKCPFWPHAAAETGRAIRRRIASRVRMPRILAEIQQGYNHCMQEIEIKFLVRDVKTITEKLKRLGFQIAVGR